LAVSPKIKFENFHLSLIFS